MLHRFTRIFILFSFLLCTTFFFSSCSDDDGIDACDTSSFDQKLTTISSDFTTSLQNFAGDPTDENCQEYLQSYDNYLNFLKEFRSCGLIINGEEISSFISELERDRSDIPCS